jgi:hypothetical protein
MIDEHAATEGIGLWGDCGEFGLLPGFWRRMLTLARQYGWRPDGTLPPREEWKWDGEPDLWDGSYWPGVGQEVTDHDARGMAAALEQACADIPEPDALVAKEVPDDRAAGTTPVPLGTSASGPTRFTFKEAVGGFIEHCRECGGFDIGEPSSNKCFGRHAPALEC